jgi:DNA-binding protein WhiA
LLIGGNKNLGLTFTTENAAVARKAFSLIKTGFSLAVEVVVKRGRRLKKMNTYQIKVAPAPGVRELLTAVGFWKEDGIHMVRDSSSFRRSCCRRAYLRGAFLGGGSVNRPEGDYHMELVTDNYQFAQSLTKIMKYFELPVRLTERKQSYLAYLKDGDAIISFLRLIGAHNALLSFENVRVVKDVRNQVNRLVNCETANLQKTVEAAVRQVASIRYLDEAVGLEKLPIHLKEAARLRLEHPEAPLSELVELSGGQLSRSGLNHRLRRLEMLAEKHGLPIV